MSGRRTERRTKKQGSSGLWTAAGVLLCMVMGTVTGCNRHSAAWSELVAAEELMEEHSDSALAVLGRINPDTLRSDEEKAYWGLLYTQAQDKQYMVRTSDSLMRRVVDYYEHHKSPKHLMRAYYYLGTVYEDLQDAPQAVDYYQRAVQVASKGSEQLLGLIYSRMGTLLIYRRLRQEGVEAYRKAYQLAVQTNDTLRMAYRLEYMGRAYASLHHVDSTLYYYEQAVQYRPNPRLKGTKAGLAGIFLQLKRYDRVRELIEDNPTAYDHWAEYYQGVGMRDSSVYWYRLSLKQGNIYAQRAAAEELSRYAAEDGRLAEALDYHRQALALQDSIQQQEQVEAVKRIESLYNYQNIEQERQRLALRQEQSRQQIVLLFFTLLSILVALVLLFLRYRRKSAEQREQRERADNLAKLVADMQQKQEGKNPDKSPVYHAILQNWENPSFVLSEEDKRLFLEEMDRLHHNFVTRLKVQCPTLSPMDLLVCCLIRIEMPVSRIAHVICRAPNSVSTMRRRIYEKIFHEKGEQKKLDEYLMSL